MFDAQTDLAAIVFSADEDPDAVLLEFCAELTGDGFRPVGLVQAGHCHGETDLTALLIHTGERIGLTQDLGPCAAGCRLDANQLLTAGARVATAVDHGADLVVLNRFGKLECEGKGLAFLIELAMSANIPTLVAVSSLRFPAWLKYSEGMTVKLDCNMQSLRRWWAAVSTRRGVTHSSREAGRVDRVH